jgi:hypothetical protein
VHSLNHPAVAQYVAADRIRSASGAERASRRHRPPPVRGRAAYAVARVAHRLDADVARRAVA